MPLRTIGWMNVSGRPRSRIPAADEQLSCVGRLGLVELREPRRLEEVALLEDRERPRQPPGVLREPSASRRRIERTDRSRADFLDVRGGLRGRSDASFAQSVHELAQQERRPTLSRAGRRRRTPDPERSPSLDSTSSATAALAQRRESDHLGMPGRSSRRRATRRRFRPREAGSRRRARRPAPRAA